MDETEKYIEAGKIASAALKYSAKFVKPGKLLLDATLKAEEKVLDLGGEFAFPPQISVNDIAAHYCAYPEDDIVFKKGDVVKIDVGAMIDGYIGDNALTVDLGNNESLVKASREALENAIKILRPGLTIGEIGKTIQETIEKHEFSPVKNLSGHGLSQYKFHDSPNIPNIKTNNLNKLKKGQVIAIEPFASTGSGIIYESSPANIFSLRQKKPVRNIITRNVLREILKFKGMPFTTRWLSQKISEPKVNFAIREMLQLNMLYKYPPLPDSGKGLVSQAEHTIIIDEEPIVTTK